MLQVLAFIMDVVEHAGRYSITHCILIVERFPPENEYTSKTIRV